ncbi:MAG TPA: cytochrome c biogenesis protein CcsA [Panacibacter sp.]|nr:cytochrome c biogenesis protein CcsA [Panacibacter sp.]HNP45613.1 cytochrome c biogenesis protein CcsA [Panacibacter sp.]
MNYNGEHLLPGQLGHFLAILSFTASLLATIAYFKASRLMESPEKQSWLRFARKAFITEAVSVLGIYIILFYIISNHYHEYFYAWDHSSRALSLQPQYLLASFWEGQEGSFMLWSFWHCVLGLIFIKRVKKWEAPVLTIISLVQLGIASMLLGVYIFNIKIGSNPFILFREQMPNLPIFTNPDYLNLPKIKEGNDLNTLLQNYWMVIHPPILFLGFASTIIPFGFAYAGLVSKDHSWTKPALSWAGFSAAVLGTGIMMGAAWAYESLSFGGYWAWDPVENASLVPWLVLVAGLHTNLIYKSTGYSLRSTYAFYVASFILVLYSTFLTRTGVLGDTSVHAFTGADMTSQLYLLMNSFIWVAALAASNGKKEQLATLALFVVINLLVYVHPVFSFISCVGGFIYYVILLNRHVPTIQKEESTYSREFWMFIGSLVLFLSGMIITAKTSTPVFNIVFGTNIAPPVDPKFAHNQVQIFIAIIIGVLTAVTQYLKYKDTPRSFFLNKVGLPTAVSLVISVCISLFGNINYTEKGVGYLAAIHIAIFAATYGIVANAAYIWVGLKGKMKAAGASVAHIGFTIFLLGVVISSAKKEVLSDNTTGIAVFQKTATEDPAENITLFKGVKTDMGKFDVTYTRDTANEFDRKKYFELKFQSKDGKDNFFLYPDILQNNKGQSGFSPNPDKNHYLTHDVFAYVTSWSAGKADDTSSFRPQELKAGDTVFYSNGVIILNKVEVKPEQFRFALNEGETPVSLDMMVIAKDGKRYPVRPGFAVNMSSSSIRNFPDTVMAQNLVIRFDKIVDDHSGQLQIGIKETSNLNDLMTLKVYDFPFIGLVWIGIIVMVFGFLMSVYQRIQKPELSTV